MQISLRRKLLNLLLPLLLNSHTIRQEKPSISPFVCYNDLIVSGGGLSKKIIASTAVNSPLGKKLMKNMMNENTQELLQSLTRIIKKKSGSLKKVALSSSPFFCLEH